VAGLGSNRTRSVLCGAHAGAWPVSYRPKRGRRRLLAGPAASWSRAPKSRTIARTLRNRPCSSTGHGLILSGEQHDLFDRIVLRATRRVMRPRERSARCASATRWRSEVSSLKIRRRELLLAAASHRQQYFSRQRVALASVVLPVNRTTSAGESGWYNGVAQVQVDLRSAPRSYKAGDSQRPGWLREKVVVRGQRRSEQPARAANVIAEKSPAFSGHRSHRQSELQVIRRTWAICRN